MRPFFGLSNRLSSILISFVIFGYSIYVIIVDRVIKLDQIRIAAINESQFRLGGTTKVEYEFESSATSLFGLYEMEIAFIKVAVSFLLFIVLLVGASQKSKILLRIWMMIHALVIILGFIATILKLTESHLSNTGEPSNTLTRFLITLAVSLWFFAIVLSLHEDIELEDEARALGEENRGRIRSCIYVQKKGTTVEEKCPPYFDC